jgi:chorismate mutase
MGSKLNLNISAAEPREWLDCQSDSKPLIISGPCSAESENQVVATARAIAATGKVQLFRAGIWKPRTRPGGFQGVGTKGLAWLAKVKKETGLSVTTEVANAHHVEACLNAGIDVVWIGARTTVNPFSVQEIADALKGIDIPVMVKNPINPDIKLWLGALERINNAGITRILAIHRGFSSYAPTPFRNSPNWELPIELMILCPKLPIICDPSHIAGQRRLLELVSQKALDLNMSGLMIECHLEPDKALSDASQQVTPAELTSLLESLILRRATSENHEFTNQLDRLRSKIDDLDDRMVKLFAMRMDIVREIGAYKRENRVTIFQLKRWDEILRRWLAMGVDMGLSVAFLRDLLQLIHRESIDIQTKVMNQK